MELKSFMRLLPTAVLLAGCYSNPYYNPAKPHHTAKGFRNNYPHEPPASVWKWRWEQFWNGVPKDPEGGYQFELAKPDLNFLAANRAQPTLTWIGHATLLLQINGMNILTDPHLTERASPLRFAGPKRLVPPAISLEALPHIDIVVISHNHYDHLDAQTVEGLNAQPGGPPQFFVPLGLKPWFAEHGIGNVVELDWWELREHRGLKIHLLPVQHWSARTPFDRNQTLWGSWLLEHPRFKFFFTGDSGYSLDFRDIARRFGPIDLAAIPIGAYEPRWFMKTMHVNPEEAVKIHQDLRATYSVAMHWGTFRLTDETLDEPPKRLAAALTAAGIPTERFFTMRHGETRKLDTLFKISSASSRQKEDLPGASRK
jgi:N-acyl-phosphatidylethanolamine-hydrolysing phospholipase D